MRSTFEPVTVLTWAMPWLSRSSTPICDGVNPFLLNLQIRSCTCRRRRQRSAARQHTFALNPRVCSGRRSASSAGAERAQRDARDTAPRAHLRGGGLEPRRRRALVRQRAAAHALPGSVHAPPASEKSALSATIAYKGGVRAARDRWNSKRGRTKQRKAQAVRSSAADAHLGFCGCCASPGGAPRICHALGSAAQKGRARGAGAAGVRARAGPSP